MKSKLNFSLIMVLIAMIALSSTVLAQTTGRITGSVVEKGTQAALIGANVSVVGTNIGAATDNQGNFLIGNVPTGTYTISASFIGYEKGELSVQVTVGEVSTVNFELQTSVLVMGAIAVTSERQVQSQAAAINAQYNASNIKNVISADLMGTFPDEEAAEALSRIPGVDMSGTTARMRGLTADWTLVTLNGEKIPSVNAAEDRHSNLETFPIDLIQSIEVSKGQTADMDADALAGSIDLKLKDAPSRRLFAAKIYQGYSRSVTSDYNINQVDYFGPTKASLTLGDALMDGKFGYSVAGTYQREAISERQERWRLDYGNKYWNRFEDGRNSDGEKVDRGLRYFRDAPTETKEIRAGINTALMYKPALGHKLSLKTYYSAFNLVDYDLELQDNHGYFDDGAFKSGKLEKLMDVKKEPKHVANVALGGEHMLFGNASLDWAVQYTTGRGAETHDNQLWFASKYGSGGATGEDYSFDGANFENETFKEDDVITAFNLKKPFFSDKISGYFKGGFKYKYKDRFQQKLDSEIGVFDEDLADPDHEYVEWVTGVDDDFMVEWDPPEELVFATESGTSQDENYTAIEKITSGYLMAELWFGQNLMVLPGVRVERTSTNAESRFLESRKGDVVQPTPSDLNYTDVFPSMHVRYKLPKDLNIRASVSKGISRPSFRESIGFNDYDSDDLFLNTGNPDLKPERATNLDLLLEHYAANMASHMSVGFFYKNIKDVVEEVEDSFLEEDNKIVNGFHVTDVETWRNVGTGIAQGIELSVQRQLDFIGLPNIGVLANWTHQLDTYLESPDGERRALTGVAEDIVNLALSVEAPKIGFSSRLSYQYKAKFLRGQSSNHEEWNDAANILDLNVRKTLTNSVSLIFNARNLLGEDLFRRFKNIRADRGSNPLWNLARIIHRGTEIYGGFQFNL